MIFVLATPLANGHEKHERKEPHELLRRLLTLMEQSTHKRHEVLCIEVMHEVDSWDCIDEQQADIMRILKERGLDDLLAANGGKV